MRVLTYLFRTQRWNGISFGATTLKILGLRVQLGHCTGDSCPTPERTRGDDFVVLDLDHVHSVSLDFCGCGHAGTDHVGQLMEHRFWPATVENPKTAATFRLLEHFEILQYESKISPFEVWSTISRLTDNTGIDPPKVRFKPHSLFFASLTLGPAGSLPQSHSYGA